MDAALVGITDCGIPDVVLERAGLGRLAFMPDEDQVRDACRQALALLNGPSDFVRYGLRVAASARLESLSMDEGRRDAVLDSVFGATDPDMHPLLHVASSAEYWLDESTDKACASVLNGGRVEHHFVNTPRFREHLTKMHYDLTRKAPTDRNFRDTVRTLEAQARYGGRIHSASIRLAEADGCLYVDIGDGCGRVVEVAPGEGWRIVDHSKVRFVRPGTQRPLVVPEKGGGIEALREFVNAPAETFMLFVGLLVACFRCRGPYHILAVQGGQGSGKTTASRVFMALADPHTAPLRSPPKSELDLIISATSCAVLGYDNMAVVPTWLSDALCRLSTGGGFSRRRLFTDSDEMVLEVQRPTVLNGIEQILEQTDALDRAVVLNLPPLKDGTRRTEFEFWARFNEAAPGIMGALFDGVSRAMRDVHRITLSQLPRMADAVAFAAAAAPAFGWDPHEMVAAFDANQSAAVEAVLDEHLVADGLRRLLDRFGAFEKTPTELLQALNGAVAKELRQDRRWPTSPRALSNALKRVEPALARIGIRVVPFRRNDANRTRVWQVTWDTRESPRAA